MSLTRAQLSVACGVFVFLSAALAFANDYPVGKISLILSVDCRTSSAKIFPNDFQIAPTIQDPPSEATEKQILENLYEGKIQGFTYSLDARRNVVLTKAKSPSDDSETSITLGPVDPKSMSALCRVDAKGAAVMPQSVGVALLPNIEISEQAEWTGYCFRDQPGAALLRPYFEKLVITDNQENTRISLESNGEADLGHIDPVRSHCDDAQ